MPTGSTAALRKTIEEFLSERQQTKLDRLASDDPKRARIIDAHQRENWLADATRRVAQLQVVTHALKATHP
ncbi:type I-F CRISPR-associated protein Csy1, partial [Arhodomonas sp. KWT]